MGEPSQVTDHCKDGISQQNRKYDTLSQDQRNFFRTAFFYFFHWRTRILPKTIFHFEESTYNWSTERISKDDTHNQRTECLSEEDTSNNWRTECLSKEDTSNNWRTECLSKEGYLCSCSKFSKFNPTSSQSNTNRNTKEIKFNQITYRENPNYKTKLNTNFRGNVLGTIGCLVFSKRNMRANIYVGLLFSLLFCGKFLSFVRCK